MSWCWHPGRNLRHGVGRGAGAGDPRDCHAHWRRAGGTGTQSGALCPACWCRPTTPRPSPPLCAHGWATRRCGRRCSRRPGNAAGRWVTGPLQRQPFPTRWQELQRMCLPRAAFNHAVGRRQPCRRPPGHGAPAGRELRCQGGRCCWGGCSRSPGRPCLRPWCGNWAPDRSLTASRRSMRRALAAAAAITSSPPCAVPGAGAWWPGGWGWTFPCGGAIAAYYRSQFLNSVLPGGVLGDVHRG